MKKFLSFIFAVVFISSTFSQGNEPCTATPLTPGASCAFTIYSLAGMTPSAGPPAPGCASFGPSPDAWFSIVVPASGIVILDGNTTGTITDGGMAAYSGANCNALTLISCNDDGSANGLMPYLNLTGLTAGSTIYVRIWDYSDGTGTFALCAQAGTPPPPPPPPGQGESCSMPNSFCSQPIVYPAGTGGTVTAPVGPAYDCLGSQPNPAWFNMQVATSGDFTFSITAGSDIDFIIWGPFASPTGACLAGLTAGNVVDCSFSGTATETAIIPNAIAGEYYIIMITNYSGVAQNINFSQPGGIGTANCNILCNITGLTGTPGACQAATNTYDVTGTITTTSPPSSGTLTISSSCGGPPTILNPPFSTSMNYTLTGIPTTTGACTITANYSADVTCTRTVTVNSPAPCGSCTMTASNTGPYCSGSTISLTTTAVAGATYAWVGPNGFTGTGQSVTIPAATAAMGGVYTVTSTAGPAICSSSTTVSVTTTPTVTVNSPSICSGNSASLTANGATTYSWSPATNLSATNGATVSANPVATATYVVTGANGTCTSTANSIVTVTTTPTVTVNSVSICSGNNATLTANGATTYSWSPATNLSATTGATVIANPISTVTYVVTGSNGTCTSVANSTVTVTATPTLTVNSENICSGNNATLTASGASTYTWLPATNLSSTTGATVAANPISTITYTITGNNGSCSSIINSTVTVTPTPTITVNSPTICAGDNAFLSASGATTYVWSPATNLSSTSGANVTSNSTSTIVYTITGIDQGCSSTATSTVTVNQTQSLSITSGSYCQGGSATLTASGSTSYTWSPATGLSATTGASVIANPTITTIYTVTGASAGCNAIGTTTVTVNPNPIINAGLDATVCLGSSATISASGAVSYLWNADPSLSSTTIPSPTITPTANTTYIVTGTDINGCTGTDNVTITVPPTFTLTPLAIPTTCFGVCNGAASVTASPSAGQFATYTYAWNTGSTAQIINGLCANTYTVVVRDLASCMQSTTVTITQPTLLSISETSNTPVLCNGDNTGTASVNASGGTSPYNYFWSPNGNTTSTDNALPAGTYTVSAADVNGCSSTTTITITQPQAIVLAPVTGTTICISQSANLIASAIGGSGVYSYAWTDGTNTFTGNNINVNPTVTTSYTVSAIDGNNCLATNTQSVTVTVNPTLNMNSILPSAICEGAFRNVDVSGNGGNGVHSFTWSPMSGVTILNASGSSVKLNPTVTTNYTVTITDNCGTPSASTNFIFTVNPKPTLSISPTNASGCEPLSVNFTGTSSTSVAQCYWDFGDNGNSYNCTPSRTFIEDGNYTVTYNVTDINGCTNFITSSVNVFPVPNAVFSATPQPTTIIDPEITFTNITDANIANQTWFFNDSLGTTSSLATPSYIYSAAGEYFVTLAVETDKGCVDTTTQPVIISDYFVIYVPNAFSPDNDGYNDIFTAYGTGITKFKMGIYDRWGGKIIETEDIDKGWDGKKSNEKVEKGVYVYRMEVVNFLGEKKLLSGHVTVVR